MSDFDRKLAAASARILRDRLLRSASSALFIALVAALALIGLHKLLDLGHALYWVVAALGVVGVLSASVGVLVRRPPPLQTALALDRVLKLQERLTSALCVGQAAQPMAVALRADAAARLAEVDLDRAIRTPLPRTARALPLLIAAAILLAALAPDLDLLGRRRASSGANAEVREQLSALQSWASSLAEQAAEKRDDEALQFARELQRLLRRAEGRASAVSLLQRASQEAEALREQRSAGREAPCPSVNPGDLPALGELATALKAGDLTAAASSLAGLARVLGSSSLSGDELNRLRTDLERVWSDPGMGSSLADPLKQAADALRQDNPAAAAEALSRAADALAASDRALDRWRRMDSAAKTLQRALAAHGEPPASPLPSPVETPGAGPPEGGDGVLAAAWLLSSRGAPPAGSGEAPQVRKTVELERSAAEQAVANPQVPFACRDAVKRYFDSVAKAVENPEAKEGP